MTGTARQALRRSQRQYVMVSPALRIARELPQARGAPFPGFIEPLFATQVPNLPRASIGCMRSSSEIERCALVRL
jgi:hypothetical protein